MHLGYFIEPFDITRSSTCTSLLLKKFFRGIYHFAFGLGTDRTCFYRAPLTVCCIGGCALRILCVMCFIGPRVLYMKLNWPVIFLDAGYSYDSSFVIKRTVDYFFEYFTKMNAWT